MKARTKNLGRGGWLAALFGVLVTPARAHCQLPPAQLIQELRVDTEADGTRVVIRADGVMEHRVYLLEEQSQIVLDIMNVSNPLEDKEVGKNNTLLKRIRCQELPMAAYIPSQREKTFGRFIFDLKRPVRYWVHVEPGELTLGLRTREGEAFSAGASAEKQTAEPAGRAPEGREETVEDGGEGTPAHALKDRIEPGEVDAGVFFAPRAEKDHYRVGPEDVLQINVFELEQLNRTVRVMEDGNIDLPLIGLVKVEGLTSTEVGERVAGKLRNRFVQHPQVSVLIKEFHSRQVSLLGAVARPATYPLAGRRTLLQLLADAGGLSGDAGNVLYVFRQLPDGRSARLSVPLNDLLVKGDPHWNIPLAAGDIVSVPPEDAISVSVLGAVRRPGIYKLPVGEGASLLRVIALAGGLNERASKSGVQIKRREASGDEKVLKVDLGQILSGKKPDVTLHEGDVIVVKESFF